MKLLKSKTVRMAIVILFFVAVGLFSAGGASAKTINTSNIGVRSYVIGEHLFTRDLNQDANYNGYINTQMIMLAAKSISGHTLEDMNIYYKKADGSWVNGLTNQALSNVPENFKIEHRNLDPYIPETTYSIGYYGAGVPQVDSDYSVVAYSLTLQNLSDFKNDDETLKVDGFEWLVLAEDADGWINTIGKPDEKCQIVVNDSNYCHVAIRNNDGSGTVATVLPVGKTYHIVTRAYKIVGARTVYGEPSAATITVPNYYRVDFSRYPGDLTTGFSPAGGVYQFSVGDRYGYTYEGLAIARECTSTEKIAANIPQSDSALCPSDTEFDSATTINSDIRIAAKWAAHTYEIKVKPTDAIGAIMGTAKVYDNGSILADNYAVYLAGTDTMLFDSINPSIALSELNGISSVKLVISHSQGVFSTTASLIQVSYDS